MPESNALATISRRLRRDEKLPVLPQILVRVREVTRDTQSSASDLAEVILKDQTLTAKILRVVNSAYYRPYARRVTTATQAIVVLGFDNVRNITLAGAVQDILDRFLTQEMMVDFWSHSLATGVMAQMLAQERGLPVTEKAFVGGLLHDLGKLVLAQYYPKDYAMVWKNIKPGPSYLQAERQILHVDHVAVGLELAAKWHFDDTITSCIRFHHDLGPSTPGEAHQIARFVHYGNLVTNALMHAPEADRMPILQEHFQGAASMVDVSEGVVQDLLSNLAERMEELAQCFGIKIGDMPRLPAQMQPTVEARDETLARAASEMKSELLRQEQWMAHLGTISQALVSEPDRNKLLHTILEAATKGLGIERVLLAVVDDGRGKARVALAEGGPAGPEILSLEVPLSANGGLLARTILEGKPQIVSDTDLPVYAGMLGPEERGVLRSRALAALPVRRRGEVIGALLVDNPEGGNPIEDKDMQSLLLLANYVALAFDRAS